MTSTLPSKGQLEASISEAVIKFEKDFMGRGPLECRTYIIDDLVIVRLQGVLTPAEMKLSHEDDASEKRGRLLIKEVRQELLERGRPLLESALGDILDIPVKSLHTDISARTGERIIVFTMEKIVPFRRAPAPQKV